MDRSTPSRIAFIGECMIQLQADARDNIDKTFAGDTLNTATYLARLQAVHGAQVDYITALGDDEFSADMIAQWQAEGIGTDQVRRLPGKLPGLYYVHVDEQGERSFSYWRGESAAKDLFKDTTTPALNDLSGYDYIYVSGISLAILDIVSRDRLISLLHEAKKSGTWICFDNNYRPRLWSDIDKTQAWYERILDITDIAFLTFDDEQAVWGDATPADTLRRYQTSSISELVIKCGSDPCIIKTDNIQHEVPAETIAADKVIDTNAAGDSFSAGYLCGLLSNTQNPQLNAVIAHRVAGTVIQHRGAVIAKDVITNLLPTIQEIVRSPAE